MKTASEMTYTVSGGALNSAQPINVSNWQSDFHLVSICYELLHLLCFSADLSDLYQLLSCILMSASSFNTLHFLKVHIALYGNPPQSYEASLAMWDHTVLPATRHK